VRAGRAASEPVRSLAGPVAVIAVLAGCGGSADVSRTAPGPASRTAPARLDPLIARLLVAVDESLRARPGDGVLLYQRAALSVEAGSPADALPFIERLDAIGWDVPLRPDEYRPLADHPRYRKIAASIDARAARVSRSAVAFTIPEPDLIPEGIAVDPRTRTFYLGSIRKRKVLAIDARGAVSTFVPPGRGGLLSALGIKVDTGRDLLWVASHASRSMIGDAPGAQRAAGVLAFALADGSPRRRVLFGDGAMHLPNDMAIAADGAVYVTDSTAGRVFRIPPDRDVFEPITPPGGLVYPNGIALSPDGRLYVAHLPGIAIVDPGSGAVKPMPTVAGAPLGGIDGLVLEGGALLAVQNGIGRPRMVSIALDESGERATGLRVLENDPAALELPTTTCATGGAMYSIANSQLNAFSSDGEAGARALEAPRILRTPL
jgi:sugar lactone lactonase YvrE